MRSLLGHITGNLSILFYIYTEIRERLKHLVICYIDIMVDTLKLRQFNSEDLSLKPHTTQLPTVTLVINKDGLSDQRWSTHQYWGICFEINFKK